MIKRIIDSILAAQRDPSQIPGVANLAQSVGKLEASEVDELILQLADFGDELRVASPDLEPNSPLPVSRMDQILQPIIHQLAVRETERIRTADETESPPPWTDARLRSVETLYRLAPGPSDLRNHLLRWLATSSVGAPMDLWADLICDDPPEHRLGIGLAFAPLMQSEVVLDVRLRERLLNNATAHSQIAPVIFDLFNYYIRSGRLETHPAFPRVARLADLLGQMVGQLGRVEEGDFPAGFEAHQINQLVSDAVALIVALCDTFALTAYKPAIPKLHQALDLRHRRVQTEAAAALARLGDEAGKQALVKLAGQPISRLRVLAYAEELGLKGQISLELQGDIAIAESQLAIWLSEPDQMGLAPSDIELLDSCKVHWPSYEHPVPCYLFEYSYGTGDAAHRNIGICGPLVHAFAADLTHLSHDEIYAAFAGWQTVHEEIFQMSPSRALQAFPGDLQRLKEGLSDDELDAVNIQAIGSFFGDLVLVASAMCGGKQGTVVVDGHDSNWFEAGNAEAPIDWQLAYSIWRGKQLLNKLNSSESL